MYECIWYACNICIVQYNISKTIYTKITKASACFIYNATHTRAVLILLNILNASYLICQIHTSLGKIEFHYWQWLYTLWRGRERFERG